MEQKSNTPIIFLNIFLVLLFFGGALLAYFYGNFGGISKEELDKAFVPKTNITFNDLPEDEKKNYIHRQELPTFNEYAVTQNATKETMETSIDEPIEGSLEELRAQIITLRQKNNFLYQDNVDLANKNWELALKVRDEKQALEKERDKLLTKNLETMNEAEQQHYQNINDLTKRINELQQESIAVVKVHEAKVTSLENKIDSLEKELRNKELEVNNEVSAATKEQRISNSTLAEKNRYLLEQQKTLKEKMLARLDEMEKKLQDKRAEVDKYKAMLADKEAEKNVLLTDHTKEVIAIEQKNNLLVQSLRNDMNTLKNTHREELNKKNVELETVIHEHEKIRRTLRNELITLEGELKKEKMVQEKMMESHGDVLKPLKEKIASLEQELSRKDIAIKEVEDKALAIIAQKDTEYSNALKELKAKSLGIEGEQDKALEKLNQEIDRHKAQIVTLDDEKKKLQATIQSLEEKLSVNAVSKDERLEKNEAKHAKNYALLNEKIVQLEQDKNYILEQVKAKLSGAKLDDIPTPSELKKLEEEKNKAVEKIASLQSRIATLEKDNTRLKQSEDAQLLSIKEEFDALRKSVHQREEVYEQKIDELNTALESTKKENKVLAQAVDKTPALPKLLGSIQCDDMQSGTNDPTATCKERVSAFLQKYSARNFYEVLPIVDNGGFATLKKVQQESALKIPESEITRLTRLSNLGLGKDRAASGGKLVETFFEGKARVSYAVSSVEIPKKRGFVIRVYE